MSEALEHPTRTALSKWLIFVKERFEPITHVTLVGLFYAAHLKLTPPCGVDHWKILALGFATLAFFFKLRLYDEVKDYETDLELNPGRPLARGLVSHGDLFRGMVVCTVLEAASFALWGMFPFLLFSIAAGYSVLMYHEFFIAKWIRPLLTTYAVSHTVVSALLGIAISGSLSQATSLESLPNRVWFFAGSTWCLFNVFEFGRKTFSNREERAGVASYSKVFGKLGAVVLVICMAGVAEYCFERSLSASFLSGRIALGLLGVSGVLFVQQNNPKFGRIYRTGTSVYIVIVYTLWLLFGPKGIGC
ncbi:MAG: UbiA family prenyltransferase [Cryobacterium sp.]|nr:UbiA family prenyltransferase [Oligoflexia bacterium]